MRYSNTDKNKENGIIYTPEQIATFVAEEMLKYRPVSYESEISILDPAVGTGELLIAILKTMDMQGRKVKVVGYETDKSVGIMAQEKLQAMFPKVEVEIRAVDFLSSVEDGNVEKYDYVIANPPYIRTQIMGSFRAQKIAQKLSLSGRVDIYYAFLIYAKEVLKPSGIAGFITSNKFMTIKAGNAVRNFMIQNYTLHHIIDLGDTKLFNASVLPCITIFSLGHTLEEDSVKFTSVYQVDNDNKCKHIQSLFNALYENGTYQLPDGKNCRIQQGTLQSIEKDALWTISSYESKAWLQQVKSKTWLTFSQIGKIRVGIKTTADNVFIRDNWASENVDSEMLRPLITHRNAGQIIANNCKQWEVLYTHKIEHGKKVAVDINLFPKSKTYLLKYYEQLSGRNYVKKANRNWYEIWVPQNPNAWNHRKIVFRDISEQPQFWLDETGAVVNGDCYWIDIYPDVTEDVIYLALAVANSHFIEKYYDLRFNTKLYSGKRRYQAQYVEQFPIPYYTTTLAQKAISLVKKIIAEGNNPIASSYKKELDSIVSELFC